MKKERFEFSLDEPLDHARQRSLDAIKALGWQIRNDLTQKDRITCYVPIPDLLPQAPVYFISLYPADGSTHVVLLASDDDLSQEHAQNDLSRLKDALTGKEPASRPVTSAAGAKIFISYRRYDSADVVGRIYDRLVQAYGADKVFKDVDNIPLGLDFRKILDEAVGGCAVLLAIIGRDWLTVTNERHQRRLDDPADFVRIEIESALERSIPVIPILVREATMPRPDDLPESLRELVFRSGLQIRPDPDFHRDMDRLINALSGLL